MQLFYAINNWAGRNATLDGALRFFYVGAVPILAMLLAAVLIMAPRHAGAASRRRVALAAAICIALCIAALPAINAFARAMLDADILSPRPFVTRRVNLLVIEPNDNSFPCPEVMLAATLAMAMWVAWPRLGLLGWIFTIGLALTRVACGSNYIADVVVGGLLGAAVGALVLACCGASLHFKFQQERRFCSPKYQGALSAAALAIICVVTLFSFEEEPRFRSKIRSSLTASASAAPAQSASPPRESNLSTLATHEGEGVSLPEGAAIPASSPADTSHDQHRSDYIPKADTLMRAAWQALKLPHRILTIDVAQVRAGDSAYRSAVVRFIVERRGAAERREVLKTASRLIRAAYHADGQLQNIDVIAVMPNAEPGDFGPRPLTTPGPLPVFTASVARIDIQGRQIPANLEKTNPCAGEPEAAWLRARSLLYINERVLPASSTPSTPAPASTPAPPLSAAPSATSQTAASTAGKPITQTAPIPAAIKGTAQPAVKAQGNPR